MVRIATPIDDNSKQSMPRIRLHAYTWLHLLSCAAVAVLLSRLAARNNRPVEARLPLPQHVTPKRLCHIHVQTHADRWEHTCAGRRTYTCRMHRCVCTHGPKQACAHKSTARQLLADGICCMTHFLSGYGFCLAHPSIHFRAMALRLGLWQHVPLIVVGRGAHSNNPVRASQDAGQEARCDEKLP